MIITRTPYRISFFGGGSDYPAYYSQYGGAVLSTTIDKYCYINARFLPPFLGNGHRVVWSKIESAKTIGDIEHAGVRGCLQFLDWKQNVEITHAGDLPARSGLGSSSAFTVGMLHALHVLRGEEITRKDLAKEAISVEQEVLKETVGIQDQIACSVGGFNHIGINKDGSYRISPVYLSPDAIKALEDHLVLVFTDIQRHASEIAKEQVNNVDRKKIQMEKITHLVSQAFGALNLPEEFGNLLHDSWVLKRELSDKITNPELDAIYKKARKHGAIGGKILGAGGGGFMLLCVRPKDRVRMLSALKLLSVPVKFEEGGTKLIYG